MVIDVLTVDITQNDTTICEGDSLVLGLNNGTYSGLNSNSLAFNQGEYATIINNGFFNNAQQYTIEFWYKQTGFSGEEHIFGIDYYDKDPYFLAESNTSIIFLREQSSVTYSPGGWTHIAHVYV